ncbi:MAG: sulfite exporter TauE/SafE family protein [Actinomycetota bacterium]|nr:sulfite exporter TauE/SafE family protein [Actinomycetota bacterium]
MSVVEALATVAAGVGVGALSAYFGIGGGVVIVPFLVISLDLSQRAAEGTSLVVIMVAGAAGTWAHFRSGFVALRSAAMLGVGGIIGAIVGAVVAVQLSNPALRVAFATYLAATGIVLLITATRASIRTKGEKA